MSNKIFPVAVPREKIACDLFLLHGVDQHFRPRYIKRSELVQKVDELLSDTPRRTYAHGNEKTTILSISGAKGRGKTRTLLEIADHLQTKEKYVIYVTYNSFSSVPFRRKRQDESFDEFVLQDLAARIAYSFYRQTLMMDDVNSVLEFQLFASKFAIWNFDELMGHIAEYVMESFKISNIVFLLDEVLS